MREGGDEEGKERCRRWRALKWVRRRKTKRGRALIHEIFQGKVIILNLLIPIFIVLL